MTDGCPANMSWSLSEISIEDNVGQEGGGREGGREDGLRERIVRDVMM